jgi:hypothetical protein
VAPYALVDAGEQALELRVNGSTSSSGTGTLTAGADYSLLAWGPAASARLSLISDDNRLPCERWPGTASIRWRGGGFDPGLSRVVVD